MSDNGYKSGSNLEKVLKAGHFAFTGECGPPKGANVAHLQEKMAPLRGMVDAINVTDNQTAVVRMSSKAASALMVQAGLEPNFQMVCRDRNRIAMQSDILGVHALGIRNMLCLSGDHQLFGNHPEAKNVYDLDSMQLIALVKQMRDEGKFLNGEEIDGPPKLFIGAAANPFADPTEYRVYRLANKIDAGADFIQTQCIYNMPKFREFVKMAVDQGLTEKCALLAGITPLKSVGMAKYMNKFVPGVFVPDDLLEEMASVPKEDALKKGMEICARHIRFCMDNKVCDGVHVMAIGKEEIVPDILKMADLL